MSGWPSARALPDKFLPAWRRRGLQWRDRLAVFATRPGVLATLRLLWCMAGVFVAIALALTLVAPPASPFLLASLGGSAVFLFGLTRAPAAQPRALFGGHLGGALIGICCYRWFGDALWVYALALALTLAIMLATRTVHPPAGANPLIMIHTHAGFAMLWQPVLLGIACLALVAWLWSRCLSGLARYPVDWKAASPPKLLWGGWD